MKRRDAEGSGGGSAGRLPAGPLGARSAVLRIHVQPRAARTEVVGRHGDAIKIRLRAPPVDGAANEELVRFLADRLGVPRASVRIVSGAAGRLKRIEVAGLDLAAAQRLLTG